MPQEHTINVIVFGETGAGKSSLLNMLDGDAEAPVNDGALGVTFQSTPYDKTIRDSIITVFDTAGLNEAPGGTVPPRQAVENLYQLIRKLENGLNLLVYVMRGPRIKGTAEKNYRLFFEGFCRKRVPIVLIVTGLENRADMASWWEENKAKFDSYRMFFSSVACVTATKGKLKDGKYIYETEYEASKKKVEDLIYEFHSKTPWKMSFRAWFFAVAFKVHEFCSSTLGFDRRSFVEELERAVRSRTEFSREEISTASSVGNLNIQTNPPNVIIFGESGAGKSSIINMLDGGVEAPVGDHATGVTFGHMGYEKKIAGATFKIYDTAGLDEGSSGTATPQQVIESLYRLICKLDDGVNLLIYVMRASRLTSTAEANYRIFFEIFCHKNVPIVIIVTSLENREPMEGWWDDNKEAFDKHNMTFKGHACITATAGKEKNGVPLHAVSYEDSKLAVESLILRSFSVDAWKLPRASWFASVAIKLHNFFADRFGLKPKIYVCELCQALEQYGGLSHEKAMEECRRIMTSS